MTGKQHDVQLGQLEAVSGIIVDMPTGFAKNVRSLLAKLTGAIGSRLKSMHMNPRIKGQTKASGMMAKVALATLLINVPELTAGVALLLAFYFASHIRRTAQEERKENYYRSLKEITYPLRVENITVKRLTDKTPIYTLRPCVWSWDEKNLAALRNPGKGEPLVRDWEKQGIFNLAGSKLPGDDRTAYFIYRAQGKDKISRLGLAVGRFDENNRLDIDSIKRFPRPLINIRPGSIDERGCEDPRIQIIDDQVVITYVAVSKASFWFKFKHLHFFKSLDNFFGEIKLIFKMLNHIRKEGWTGELFAQLAIATMSIDDFKQGVEKWLEGDTDRAFNWERFPVDEGEEYNKDGVVFKDKKGTKWMLDRPEHTKKGQECHRIRFRRTNTAMADT